MNLLRSLPVLSLSEIYHALHPGSLSAHTEGSDRHDNRTPSGCLATYRSPHPYPHDADRERIYWEAVVESLVSKEDSNCTLVSAAVLSGIPYSEVREGFRKIAPDVKLDYITFSNMTVRDIGILTNKLVRYVSSLLGQQSLPEALFLTTNAPVTRRLFSVPQDCGVLVTCYSPFARHMVACVEGKVYGLKEYAKLGGTEFSTWEDTHILPMERVPQIPVTGWVEFRRE